MCVCGGESAHAAEPAHDAIVSAAADHDGDAGCCSAGHAAGLADADHAECCDCGAQFEAIDAAKPQPPMAQIAPAFAAPVAVPLALPALASAFDSHRTVAAHAPPSVLALTCVLRI